MKKIRNIGLILGMIILISSTSNAQYYYSSYGYAQNWQLPRFVQHSIYDNYYGYEVAHVQRYHRHGYQNYNVLLHRNGWFVELRFDQHGHVYRTIRHRNHYPLMSHNCSSHCGYHRNYYATYYPKYHKHYNHGHKKVVYVSGNKHNKHNKYYTNIHVEKQHKQQNQYKGNAQSNQQKQRYNGNSNKQSNVNNNANQQQRRTSTVVRKPQQTNNRNVEQKRPQTSSSNRSQYLKGQKSSSGRQQATTAAKKTVTYRNGRSPRN